MMRPLKLLALLVATLLLTTGCTGSYWSSFLKTSQVEASVATRGKVVWKEVTLADDSTAYQPTKTAPSVNFSLLKNSSPVDILDLEVAYYSPATGELLEDLYAYIPFMLRVQSEDPTPVTLSQIITNQLLELTDPNRGNDRITDIDIEAVVKFVARDQFRNSATFQITVPISIEVE
ncbi:hypothetical protein D3C86_1728850 [compost metagenome]